VRLFVVLHLAAVGVIYALAWVVGGGWGGPPTPRLTRAPATVPTAHPLPKALAPNPPVVTAEPTALPSWAQRADIAPPWESR
jgi:hypothetical protein